MPSPARSLRAWFAGLLARAARGAPLAGKGPSSYKGGMRVALLRRSAPEPSHITVIHAGTCYPVALRRRAAA
ncbi:hypothetical protein QR79_03725, partial [Methylobacterium indicum]